MAMQGYVSAVGVDRCFIFGGYDGTTWLNDMYEFNYIEGAVRLFNIDNQFDANVKNMFTVTFKVFKFLWFVFHKTKNKVESDSRARAAAQRPQLPKSFLISNLCFWNRV